MFYIKHGRSLNIEHMKPEIQVQENIRPVVYRFMAAESL
jgi:hypothetical protein